MPTTELNSFLMLYLSMVRDWIQPATVEMWVLRCLQGKEGGWIGENNTTLRNASKSRTLLTALTVTLNY